MNILLHPLLSLKTDWVSLYMIWKPNQVSGLFMQVFGKQIFAG